MVPLILLENTEAAPHLKPDATWIDRRRDFTHLPGMALLFFALGLITLFAGFITMALAFMSQMGLVYVLIGASTISSSLLWFAIYAVLARLDRLIEVMEDRREGVRQEPAL